MSGGGWRDLARCAETDPEIFFPEQGGRSTAAKAVCASCEVSDECLDDALRTDEPGWEHGIRGGMGPGERRVLRAERYPDHVPQMYRREAGIETYKRVHGDFLTTQEAARACGVHERMIGRWRDTIREAESGGIEAA